MKLPAALCYFGIVFAAAASGATAGETEDAKTLLEPLSPDDSFEQQPAARSLRGNIIWEDEADDFRTALTPPGPPTAAPDDLQDSETAGGGEEDIWGEESGNFIWGEESGNFRGELTSPPTAAPDHSETAGGGEEDAKTEEDISVTQAPPGKCHQVFKTLCKQFDPISCVRSSIAAKKYCKLNSTTKKCVDKCAGLKIATCTKEKHCRWVK